MATSGYAAVSRHDVSRSTARLLAGLLALVLTMASMALTATAAQAQSVCTVTASASRNDANVSGSNQLAHLKVLASAGASDVFKIAGDADPESLAYACSTATLQSSPRFSGGIVNGGGTNNNALLGVAWTFTYSDGSVLSRPVGSLYVLFTPVPGQTGRSLSGTGVLFTGTQAQGQYVANQSYTGTLDIAQGTAVTGRDTLNTYNAVVTVVPTPSISSINPVSGPTTGGSVTISGSGFSASGNSVTFGGTLGTITAQSTTSITVTPPNHAPGSVAVVVTNADGESGTSPTNYTYVAAPTVGSVSPTSGPVTGTTSVTITGTGFTGATAVTFGVNPATSFVVNSATQITATAPAGSIGTVSVGVTTAGGSASLAGAYTYVAPTVTLAPTTLPAGASGVAYSQTITASGGTAPYTYAVSAGALPAGLSLSTAGVLSGTPTASGAFNFTVTATDSSGGGGPYSGARAYALTIAAPTLTLAPGTLPDATVGATYSQTITASGGAAPYSYAVTAGALPAGVSLSGTGALSGTPTAGGTFAFTVTATDATAAGSGGPYSAARAYSLTVAAPTVALAPPTLPDGISGVAYSQTITASGGTAPYAYAVTAGALPAGVTLSTGGVLSGTPTVSGTFNFTVTASDSSTGSGPYSGTRAYSLTIAAAPTIALAPASLPDATVGTAYSQAITASGGVAPYSYAVTAGALPAGVSLSAGGALSGTPTAGGTFAFTITATDSTAPGGGGPYSGSRAYSLTVAAPALALAPPTLPDGSAGVAYSQTITASGGTAPYAYAITAGALPAGLTLSSAGVLSGTPTSSGSFSFSVTATDSSSGAGPYAGTRSYTLTIAAPTVVLAPASLPDATVGTAYSQAITASGGTAPYSYAVTAGALPAGVSLSAAGALSGTPTAGGSFVFTVTATDSTAAGSGGPYSASRAYSLTAAAPALALAPPTLPDGSAGVAYSQTITASGGTAPYAYAVTAGALPAGVSLSAGGVLSGTPTASGTFAFTITATDSSTGGGPYSATRAYSLTIAAAPTIALAPASVPDATIGTAYSQAITASGGVAPYSYAVTAGALPAGVSLSAGGVLSGTPTAGGTFAFTITATDSTAPGSGGPYSGSRAYSLTVAAPTVALAPASLPAGSLGAPYSATITASGGTAPYAFAVTAGALPPGVSLNASGLLSGTATASGSFSFSVTATDSSTGSGPYAGTRSYTLPIAAPPTIALAPASLPDATVGAAYSQTITASGGAAPYGYAVTAGALPAGVSLSAGGTLSGAPTASGNFTFTVTATDSTLGGGGGPYSGSRSYSLTVAAAPLAVTAGPASGATVGGAYSQSNPASGGLGPYVYALASGALPAGTSLNPSTGAVTGTPTTAGAFSYAIGATDSQAIPAAAVGATVSGSVAKVSQTISFAPLADTPLSASPLTLSATSSSGLVVTFGSPSPAVCTVSGTTLTLLTPGTCVVNADQPGDGTYNAAPQVQRSFTVTPPVTPAPTAANLSGVTVPYNTATAVDLAGSISGAYASVAVVSPPAHGSTSVNGAVVTYTPTADYSGADSFTYAATGPGGTSSPATVSLTVAAPPAPVVTPPPPPPAESGGSYSVDLLSYTTNPVTGYQITVSPRFGTASVEATGLDQPQGAGGRSARLRYTPGPNFIGDDQVTVVAVGPGGQSAPAVFTFNVSGKAPDLTAQAPSSGSVTISPTTGLVGGPFQGLQITRQPAFGTATISGLTVVFSPGLNNGTTSLDYVILLSSGPTAAGRIDLQVGAAPIVPVITATTPAGRPVTVSLTANAQNGPFTAATTSGPSVPGAGSATLAAGGTASARTYDLTFTPAGAFTGRVDVPFTLSNGVATTTGVVQITVEPRPDPSLDPDVRGLVSSQTDAARRFARAQTDNFNQRLEQVRDGDNSSRYSASLNMGPLFGFAGTPSVGLQQQFGVSLDADGLTPRDRANREEERAFFDRFDLDDEAWGDVEDVGQHRDTSGTAGSDGGKRSAIGVWAGGSLDWGRLDAQGRRDTRFSTSGLSAGVDMKVADGLILGGGVGYGGDHAAIGDRGTASDGRSTVGVLYGSWRALAHLHLTGLIGHGSLDYDTRRWATDADAFAFGERSGSMTFGSLGLAYDRRTGRSNQSVYGRMETSRISLDGFSETGAEVYALSYDAMDATSLTSNLGVRMDWVMQARDTVFTPSVRMEWRHEFDQPGDQIVAYADWLASPRYGVDLQGWSRDTLSLDVGGTWIIDGRLNLALAYRSTLGSSAFSQGLQFKLMARF